MRFSIHGGSAIPSEPGSHLVKAAAQHLSTRKIYSQQYEMPPRELDRGQSGVHR
jgi:hypothetical protein